MRMTRTRKILLWTTVFIVAVLIAAAALLVFLPRIVNLGSIRAAIERTIAQELGGAVSIDRIDLTIIPLPRVVVVRPVFSIPGTVSGSLDSLEIRPALLPLFSGVFRIENAVLNRPDITLLMPGQKTGKDRKRAAESLSAEQIMQQVIGNLASTLPGITISVDNGSLTLMEDGRRSLALREIQSRFVLESFREPASMSGSLSFALNEGGPFPGAVIVNVGQFEASARSLSFTRATIRALDSSFIATGTIEGYLGGRPGADLALSGKINENMVQWIRTEAGLPRELTVHAPLTLTSGRLQLSRSGTIQAKGAASLQGASLNFDIALSPDRVLVRELRLRDEGSDARMTLDAKKQILELSFVGNLTNATLIRIFEHGQFPFGWVKGDLRVTVDHAHPLASSARGSLEGEGLVIPYLVKLPLTIDRLSLRADNSRITLDTMEATLNAHRLSAGGTISASGDGLLLDLDLSSPDLTWDTIEALFTPGADSPDEDRIRPPAVSGKLRLSVGALKISRFLAQDLKADVVFNSEETRVGLKQGTLCGVSLPGTVVITSDDTAFDFRPAARAQDLGATLACFAGQDLRIAGTFDLSGRLAMNGSAGTWLRSLRGDLAMTAQDGHVYQDLVFIRVLSYLNFTDLLRGSYATVDKEGIPFTTFRARTEIKNGVMQFSEAVLASKLANFAARGSVDLPARSLDITVLVAPFTNIDAVVKWIPLVGQILGNNLVTVPVRIKGPYQSAEVTALPISAVGEGLFNIMKRTLTLPFTIIEPFFPKEKEKAGSDPASQRTNK